MSHHFWRDLEIIQNNEISKNITQNQAMQRWKERRTGKKGNMKLNMKQFFKSTSKYALQTVYHNMPFEENWIFYIFGSFLLKKEQKWGKNGQF